MIRIVEDTIDTAAVLASVQTELCGAGVLFVGTTRKLTNGRETERLDYECYHEMAIKKMTELRDLALEKWQLEKASLVHRIGTVAIGETSVAVAVGSPHREAAFEAARWLIDKLKKEVPIWKKESWTDGTQEWIHPDTIAPTVELEANES